MGLSETRARRTARAFQRCLPVQAGAESEGELAQDLPVVPRLVRLREHRRAEPCGVPDRQRVEDQVVVVTLESGRRREDDVGMPGGLVEVEVDGHHEVQRVERFGEAATVGGREDRVAGQRDEGPDPAVTGSLDLLAHDCRRELAAVLRKSADTAPEAVVVSSSDQPPELHRRLGEHHAARAVEVSRQQVEAGDRPVAQRAESGGRDPHPAVRRGTVRRAELPRDPLQVLGREPAQLLRELRGERLDQLAEPLHAVDVRRRTGQALGQQRAQHREQHHHVAPRADEPVLGGDRGRLGTPWVEHHDPTATLLDRPGALREVRRGHQGAVRRHRVRPEHQEVRRAVQVGDRDAAAGGRRAARPPAGAGAWSTVVALKRLRVPSDFTNGPRGSRDPRAWTFGLPR